MDLMETWKKLDDERLSKPLDVNADLPTRSHHTLARMRRVYLLRTNIALFFTVGFAALFVVFEEPVLRIGLGLLIVAYLAFLISSVNVVQKYKRELPVNQQLLSVLREMQSVIETDRRFEQRVSIVLYPIACTTGFATGYMVSHGGVMEIFTNTRILITLFVTVLILTPLSYLLAQWLHKKSYGKALESIKGMILELEGKDN